MKWLVFIMEMESVYCAVRTGSLNIIRLIFIFKEITLLRRKLKCGLFVVLWATSFRFVYLTGVFGGGAVAFSIDRLSMYCDNWVTFGKWHLKCFIELVSWDVYSDDRSILAVVFLEGGKYPKSKEHEFTLCSMYYSVLPKTEKNVVCHCVKVVKLLSEL